MRTASDRVTERGFTAALSPTRQYASLLRSEGKRAGALVLQGGRRPAQDACRGRSTLCVGLSGENHCGRQAICNCARMRCAPALRGLAYIFSPPSAAGFPERSHVMSPVWSRKKRQTTSALTPIRDSLVRISCVPILCRYPESLLLHCGNRVVLEIAIDNSPSHNLIG
jgi:hypothetical protein